jgi:signal transduction histidine kinase
MDRDASDAGSPPLGRLAARWYVLVVALLALVYFGAVLLATGSPGRSLRATVFAVAPGVGFAFVLLRIGRRVRWFDPTGGSAPRPAGGAVGVPTPGRLAPPVDGTRRRLVALHAALCLGYGAAWSATVVVLFALDRWLFVADGRFEVRPDAFSFTMFTAVLLYGGIAGAAFGVETTARLRGERARAARAETLRVRAELAALRAQLNPHFLFNTLHTVLGLVRSDPARAEEALQDLGDVLRYALDVQRGDGHVALREELEFVERYLAIERVRLGDRLRIENQVSPAALACRVPAFTVQPLVENAIRYAVACRAQGGRVRIAADREPDGRLCVVVSDDGAAAPPTDGGAGLGLALVRQRLDAAFGAAAQVATERTEEGFVVTLRVPTGARDGAG